MAGSLPRLLPTSDPADRVDVQESAFSIDVSGRYICSTWEEATNNGGVPFDVVVIGAGMFGAYCAEKVYRNSNLRVLLLEAGHTSSLSTSRILRVLDSTSRAPLGSRRIRRIQARVIASGAYRGAAKSASPGLPTALADDRSIGADGPPRLTPADLGRIGRRSWRRSSKARANGTMSMNERKRRPASSTRPTTSAARCTRRSTSVSRQSRTLPAGQKWTALRACR